MSRYLRAVRNVNVARQSPLSARAAFSPVVQRRFASTEDELSSSAASYGIGKTHAKNDGEDSIVPKVIQKAVPEAVERALPDSIHNTGDSVTHAKQGGEDSVVPKGAQKAVPEAVERALPDSLHNTGDSKK